MVPFLEPILVPIFGSMVCFLAWFCSEIGQVLSKEKLHLYGGKTLSLYTQWQADLWLHGYDAKCICRSLHACLRLCMFACMSMYDTILKPNRNLCLWSCLLCASIKTHVSVCVDVSAYICRCDHSCIHKMAVQSSSHLIGSVICSFCGCCAQPFIRQTSLRCKACFFQPVVQATLCHTAAFYSAEQFNFYFSFHKCEPHRGYSQFCPPFLCPVLVPRFGTTPVPMRISGMMSDMWSSREYSEICP